MTINPFIASAGLIGGVLLLERATGTHVITPSASAGGNAAANALRNKTILGVTFEVPPDANPFGTFVSMRRALVAKYGQLKMPGNELYPDQQDKAAHLAVIDLWLAAFEAGRDVSAETLIDFALIDAPFSLTTIALNKSLYELVREDGELGYFSNSKLTALGTAVVNLLKWRHTVEGRNPFGTDPAGTVETFTLVLRLVTEMAHVSFTFTGATPSEEQQGLTVDDLYDALEKAPGRVATVVTDIAGDAIGSVVGAIVKSPVFWAGVLGVIVFHRQIGAMLGTAVKLA